MPRKRDGAKPASKPRDGLPSRPADIVQALFHVGPPVSGKWWDGEFSVDKLPNMIVAMRQAGVAAIGHIIKRLHDPETPDDVKDALALAIVPKLSAEFRGRLGEGGEGVDGSGRGTEAEGVLKAYGVA